MISCLPTIAKAVQQIRDGELTAAELVEFCLERIDRHEPTIASWEWVDRDGARREAARLDQLAREGQLSGLLHGVPIGIKDIIDVAGWPTKAGSPTRADHVAVADANLVSRLRQAGAIILGKTVTTELVRSSSGESLIIPIDSQGLSRALNGEDFLAVLTEGWEWAVSR